MKTKLVGVTELRTNARQLLDGLPDHDITVVRRSRPVAVILHPDRLEDLIDRLEDLEDLVAVLHDRLEPGETRSLTAFGVELDEENALADKAKHAPNGWVSESFGDGNRVELRPIAEGRWAWRALSGPKVVGEGDEDSLLLARQQAAQSIACAPLGA